MSQTRTLISTLLLGLALSLPCAAQAGKIVVAGDEWPLSDPGYTTDPVNDPGVFATNVASWFTGGGPGRFHAFSGNFGLTGANLAASMAAAGHQWTTGTAGFAFTLDNLRNYDGIFLSGFFGPRAAGLAVLTQYVNEGGNVYIAGGVGVGDGPFEAAQWNAFLNQYGMGFDPAGYNNLGGSMPISSPHPIFAGVDHLYQVVGNTVVDTDPLDDRGLVLASFNGFGLYGVYDSDAPLPGTAALLTLGLPLLARRRG